jgi:hypothetical protein
MTNLTHLTPGNKVNLSNPERARLEREHEAHMRKMRADPRAYEIAWRDRLSELRNEQ